MFSLRLQPSSLVALLLLSGCGEHDSRVVGLFGGEDALSVVLAPEDVQAFRIESPSVSNDEEAAATEIGGYPVTAGPIDVDDSAAKELAVMLRNPGTYDWPSAKGCTFEPGVAVRFTGPSGTIDVLLCFSCDELKILRNGRIVGGEDFDNARPRLLAIVKRLFPDDAAIQSLQ